MQYKELASRMEEGSIVKAVCGDYVVYKRSWIYENIDQEVVLIKSARELKPIKDGITRHKEFLREQEKAKDGKGL